MKLTDKSRWEYRAPPLTRAGAEALIRRDEWVGVARRLLPDRPLDILELGCAPGSYSAALMLDKPWTPFGIDYSDDSKLYLETLRGIGKEATLYERDLFGEPLGRTFDVVCSFGLIEHFRGDDLEQMLALHDRYIAPGGRVMIAVPNFTGFQYFWHYLFDRPDLDNHNLDTMQPATFAWFDERGYRPLHCAFVGQFRVWGNTGWTGTWLGGKAVAALSKAVSVVAAVAGRIGIRLTGRSWSPYLLYVGEKPPEGHSAPPRVQS